MHYLFVAEKPSVMRAVQAVYAQHKKEIINKVGEIDFVALAGHVCRYLNPEEYPKWKGLKWWECGLPIIPDHFEITASDDERSKKALANLKAAIKDNKYDGYIVATDSDTEGNGIYYNVAKYLRIDKEKTLRFFESSMADNDILESLYNMTDFHTNPRDVRMTEQYLVRSQFDWLVGMNATRAVTLKAKELMRIGRVKAPTLKLVYDNCKAIDEFVPHSDYLIMAQYAEGFTGTYVENVNSEIQPVAFETKEKADEFLKELQGIDKAKVTEVTRKRVSTPAPQLYKLSTLQGDAGTKYNYNPSKTLEIAQSLYEKQLISYPRTDGVYVSESRAQTFNALIESAMTVEALAGYASMIDDEDIARVKKNKRVVNDEEVKKSSHDALLPTVNKPVLSKLTQDEQNIYDMICRRFIAQFMPELVETKTVLYADADKHLFKSTGSVVEQTGWTVLYDRKSSAENIPPEIAKDTVLGVDEYHVHERASKPPKRLTTSSLVTAMENIAKYIDDKDLKKVMKDAKGIGTQATRAEIINQLITTGYMEAKTKNEQLYITDKGKGYIENIITFSIVNPEGAAMWETMFQGVREGSVLYPDAHDRTIAYVHQFIDEVNKLDIKPAAKTSTNELEEKCPYCGKKIIRFKWGYACEDSKDKICGFSVNNHNGKVKDSDIKALVNKGVTRLIKDIGVSKASGKPFSAKLKLNPKGSAFPTGYEFDTPNWQKKGKA